MLRENRLGKLISGALDVLFPLSCIACRKEGVFLCGGCAPDLPRLRVPYCNFCADPGPALCSACAVERPKYDGLRAPYLMDGAVPEMVYGLKYRNLRSYAPHIAALLSAYLASYPLSADVIVPVPLHKSRLRERGYNQAELLARALSRLTGTPAESGVLSRTRNTPPQVGMPSDAARHANIEGAFACTGALESARVLLLDDVITTGSTMNAAASALKAAGAVSVWGLALARQP